MIIPVYFMILIIIHKQVADILHVNFQPVYKFKYVECINILIVKIY